MRSGTKTAACAFAVTLAATGCGVIGGGHKAARSSRPSSATTSTAKPGDMTGGRHYRKGWFQIAKNKTAFDAHRVERYPTYSVLYIDLYVGPDPGMIHFGTNGIGQYGDQDFSGFSLIDPVGGKYYKALRQGSIKGRVFGSGHQEDTHDTFYTAGVRHPLMLYFPPLPASTQQIDVLTPGTTGEMTGIPVMNGEGAQPALPKPSTSTPKAGQTFFYPVTPPSGKIWSQSGDLAEFVEGPTRSTTTGGDEQKIGLRTDVLFAFDKATLSKKATSVLDEAVAQTRKNADPSKPPITITGFTDSKGGDAYNVKLSRRRAAAVEKYLSGKLGTSYQYRTDGKGEANPIAANTKKDGSDNPAGRARNRRVEISYKIKNTTPTTTTTSSAAPKPGARATPAAFHNGDGPVIGTVANDKVRLSVHPFYRDGKYMVGVYTLRSPGKGIDTSTFLDTLPGDATVTAMNGADFGGITPVDPATKDRYYENRMAGYLDQGSQVFAEGSLQSELSSDQDTRIFAYYPAPPANVTKVDVDAAGDGGDKLGTVRNVPVR